MALKLDPFVQRNLLDLAEIDRAIGAITHRRATLPQLAVLRAGAQRAESSRRDVIVAETEVSDLQRATNKLDAEVDQVRARARRDADRLAAGSASPKELEGLQHEIESLKRRQITLEDEELELMERREAAEMELASARQRLSAVQNEIQAAEVERDAVFRDTDAQLAAENARRAEIAAVLPSDVMALYTRILDSGKVAAAELKGSQCGACRLDIDRTALAEFRSAPSDAIVRCTECGAILVRN